MLMMLVSIVTLISPHLALRCLQVWPRPLQAVYSAASLALLSFLPLQTQALCCPPSLCPEASCCLCGPGPAQGLHTHEQVNILLAASPPGLWFQMIKETAVQKFIRVEQQVVFPWLHYDAPLTRSLISRVDVVSWRSS